MFFFVHRNNELKVYFNIYVCYFISPAGKLYDGVKYLIADVRCKTNYRPHRADWKER